MTDIRVFIACHKYCETPDDAMYLPVHVGAVGKESIGFERDDSGNNISEKNPLYCELTGLYWCWKNLSCDYLGLSHYRRYFTLKNKRYQKKHGQQASVLTLKEAENLLKTYKVLVPKKRHYYIETVYSHYSHTFSQLQLDETRKILAEHAPDYLDSWDHLMNGRSAYIFNMFIMPKEMVNEYCEWVFDILALLEKRIDTSSMTAFEKRYAGRIAERLFNVWLDMQMKTGALSKKDIKELPYLYMGEINWPKKISSFLQAKLFGKKYKESF